MKLFFSHVHAHARTYTLFTPCFFRKLYTTTYIILNNNTLRVYSWSFELYTNCSQTLHPHPHHPHHPHHPTLIEERFLCMVYVNRLQVIWGENISVRQFCTKIFLLPPASQVIHIHPRRKSQGEQLVYSFFPQPFTRSPLNMNGLCTPGV